MYLIKNTEDHADRMAHGRLRYEVYVEEKQWVDPKNLPDTYERDAWDDQSTLVIAYDLIGDPVACLRVIHQGALPLPVETSPFDVKVSLDRPCAEISRLIVRRAHRGNELLLAGLFRQATQIISDSLIEDVYAIVERPLFILLKYMSFPFVAMGNLVESYGGFNLPVRVRLSEVAESINSRRPKYTKLYSSRFDGWIDAEMCQ